jgi:hypothetical protein
MPTLQQTWSELEAYVEQIFFSQLTDKVAGYADDLAQQIEKDINSALNTFFKDLAGMIQPGLNAMPDELQLYSNGSWPELSERYYYWKNPSNKGRQHESSDFFMLSELPRIKRNSTKSKQQWRQKRVKTLKELKANPSLRMRLAKLANPSAYYGKVAVTIESHTKVNRGGRRQYKAGTFRQGVNVGGQTIKSASDYVTLTVNWLPAISGLDPDRRGVTENPQPRSEAQGLQQLPEDVKTKLLNHEHNEMGTAYRPLLGPYMLWYQDTVIRRIVKSAISTYGPT